mmetsp:Transcript_23438/g.61270  ORF Transcript_23438/g.61270 Transcript_23438/m.61270 type:complete len:230 (+) Transcript_23438:68-757(+)
MAAAVAWSWHSAPTVDKQMHASAFLQMSMTGAPSSSSACLAKSERNLKRKSSRDWALSTQCMHSRSRAWKKQPSRPCNGSIIGLPTSTQASKSRSDADASSTWPPSSLLPVSSRVLPPYFAVASRLAASLLCFISDLRLRSASPSASAFALASSSTGPCLVLLSTTPFISEKSKVRGLSQGGHSHFPFIDACWKLQFAPPSRQNRQSGCSGWLAHVHWHAAQSPQRSVG